MGAAAAWRLARRGAEVVCFDRHSPPHTFGSSHGESRIIRSAYMEGEFYVPLLREAFGLWRELEAESGAAVMTITGALMIGPRDSETVAAALASAEKHHLDARLLDPQSLAARYPAHVFSESDVAVLDAVAGFVRPELAIGAMLERLRALGGVLRADTPVAGVEATSLRVDGGREEFDGVVVAAGPWMTELAPWLPLEIERQVLTWFAIEHGAAALQPERFPVFIREAVGVGEVYGFPTLDGASVKLARHHDGAWTDPDRVDREVHESELEPLKRYVSTYMRGVTDRVSRTAVCMYTNTPDGHFAIGRSPEDERVVLLSPCSGHGFKFAPVIGDIAADLVLDGETARDLSRFRVDRF